MEQEKLRQLILAKIYQQGGKTKLSCEDAFDIASTHGVTLAEISQFCNANNIRFGQCQLGCFQ